MNSRYLNQVQELEDVKFLRDPKGPPQKLANDFASAEKARSAERRRVSGPGSRVETVAGPGPGLGAEQAGHPSSPGPGPLEWSRWTGPGATARVPLPATTPGNQTRPRRAVLLGSSPNWPRRRPRAGLESGLVGGAAGRPPGSWRPSGDPCIQAAFTDLRGTGCGRRAPWRLASPQPGPVQPPHARPCP